MTRSTKRRVWRVVAAVLGVPLALVAFMVIVVPSLTGATAYGVRGVDAGHPSGTLVVLRDDGQHVVQSGERIGYHPTADSSAVVFATVRHVVVGEDGESRWRLKGDGPAWIDPDQYAGEEWYTVPALGWVARGVSAVPGDGVTILLAICAALVAGAWGTALRARHRQVPVVVTLNPSRSRTTGATAAPIVPPQATTSPEPGSATGLGAARLDA